MGEIKAFNYELSAIGYELSMCGIAGIIDFSGNKPDEGLLRRMLGLIRHRGPDAFGLYMDDIAGLASTRLSIIDLPGGDQPIHNEEQNLWIVYNGEVFNYIELRPDLEARGHKFYTNTDTEVLLHLYEEKGPEMLKELNGQFAMAIWDNDKKELFLARDRMGIRPLFYAKIGSCLIFASEIKALFADPRIQLSTRLPFPTFFWSNRDKTAFRHPSAYARPLRDFNSGKGMTPRRYWQLMFNHNSNGYRLLGDWKERTQRLLSGCRRFAFAPMCP